MVMVMLMAPVMPRVKGNGIAKGHGEDGNGNGKGW